MITLNYINASAVIKFVGCLNKRILEIAKLIIADNYSNNSLFELFESRYGQKYDVIKIDSNNGYSTGNNFAIQYAIDKYKSKYIIISNPNASLKDETIVAMQKLFHHETIKLVGCKMIYTHGKSKHIDENYINIPPFRCLTCWNK